MGNKNSILFRYCRVIFYLCVLNKAEKYVFSSSYMELVQSLPSPLWLRSTLSV